MARSHGEAFNKAIELIHCGEFDSLFQMTDPMHNVEWTQFSDCFAGGLVDVVGDDEFRQSQAVDENGKVCPIPDPILVITPCWSRLYRLSRCSLPKTDQTDWLYQKLSGILMDLRETRSIINLRHDEKPNPN